MNKKLFYIKLKKLLLMVQDKARLAVQRGIDWHSNAKMLLDEKGWED
jgi:hypothetical protein